MIKSLFRLSLRMVTGFVQSLIKLWGLDWTAQDYSTSVNGILKLTPFTLQMAK